MVCVHFCFVDIWKHKKYTIYPLWPQLMSTSQPSCLRRGLDWCLNKMQQCFPCPRSVHRIPTVPLSPLFWQTRHTKVMQSHGSNGNSDPTFIPLTLTLFLWPWHSYTLSFISVWGVYTFELSCYILVWFQKKFSLLDMLCACILYLNLEYDHTSREVRPERSQCIDAYSICSGEGVTEKTEDGLHRPLHMLPQGSAVSLFFTSSSSWRGQGVITSSFPLSPLSQHSLTLGSIHSLYSLYKATLIQLLGSALSVEILRAWNYRTHHWQILLFVTLIKSKQMRNMSTHSLKLIINHKYGYFPN